MSGETWPDRLNYTIRIKDDFGINSYESLDVNPGPHRMFGIKYETFMRIQWAIDTSYLKLLTSTEVTQELTTQEFPYYQSQNNESIGIVCLLMKTVCWISMMLPFIFLMGRLLQERATGIQELIKMVGVSQNILGLSHFLNVLLSGLVFSIGGTILLKTTSNPLINNSNGFLIFLMLLLYFNTIMAMAFVCSYVSKGTQYVATLSVLAYIVLWIPARVQLEYDLPYIVTLATGLLPHVPMHWFWAEVSVLEMYGSGVYFSNMLTAKSNSNVSVFLCFVFMLLQAGLMYGLTWYLSLVAPGQYGQALPWNFLFKTQYWSKNEVIPDVESEEEDPMAQDPRYFESPPANAEIGIKIVNVSK
ncbi:ATP-binding cassette sub-family A member 7-like, partial [Spodoptera litura]|uniref:ATP-binding cassette sub-family A member 7-like n=1 Tax=Spodoptera litura TaxID=69820 RepID=A0A9J7IZV0_SPOLT